MLKGKKKQLFFTLFLIAVAVLLILPTVGAKELEITIDVSKKAEVMDKLHKLFPEESYEYSNSNNNLIIKGYGISAANMNEVAQLDGVVSAEILQHFVERYSAGMFKKINLGLDLQGGMDIVLEADYSKLEELRKAEGEKLSDMDRELVMTQALDKIGSRVNSFGVAEPVVRRKGDDAIEIQLPGVKNPDEVKDLLKETGRVIYSFVSEEYTQKAIAYLKGKNLEKLPYDSDEITSLENEIAEAIQVPETLDVMFEYEYSAELDRVIPIAAIVLEKKVQFAGDDIKNATESTDELGRPAVSFRTTTNGSLKFAKATATENKGKRLAITIDRKVRSAPQINNPITGGQAIITGTFSLTEVRRLASIINEGAMPVDLKIIEERTVGPSLGKASIDAGVKAVLIGLALIIVFLIIYYKGAGIIADFCLILNMLFMLAILAMIGATLTLPGIAGFILTVGMSVDANVIIYERIKEEIKLGRTPATAVANGYDRAFGTIVDANLTTFIAALILSQVGTGPIKGFAVTLMIGILCSMFVSLNISKFIFTTITSNKIKKLSI